MKRAIGIAISSFIFLLLIGGGCYLYFTAKFPQYLSIQKRTENLVGRLSYHQTIIQSLGIENPYYSSILLSGVILEKSEICPTISIKLQDSNENSSHVIAKKIVSLPCSPGNFEIDFSFPPQRDSLGKKYSLIIENQSQIENFSFWRSEYDEYAEGGLKIKDQPVNADLYFINYSKPPLYIWLLNSIFNSRFWMLLFITGLYLFWGFCTLDLVFAKFNLLNFRIRLFYSLVVSLVLPILIIQLVNFLHLIVGKVIIYCVVFVPILLFLVKQIIINKRNNLSILSLPYCYLQRIRLDDWHLEILLLIMFLIAAISRTAQVSEIFVPNWIDGIIHQQILDRVLESNISIIDLYHSGFHSFVAFLKLLFGLSSQESIIIAGQWLSLVSGLTFYPLLRKYSSSPMVALFGIAVYWFLLPFPSYLISWGRYPLLLGMVILPAAITINLNWLQGKTKDVLLPIGTTIVLFLAHYGVFLAFLLTIGLYILMDVFSRFYKKTSDLDSTRIRSFIIVMAFLMIIIVSMKILPLINKNALQEIIDQNSLVISTTDFSYVMRITLRNGGLIAWILSGVGLIYAIIRKRDLLVPTAIWIIVQLCFYSIQVWILGAAISSLTNLIVISSIPIALLAANSIEILIGYKNINPIKFITRSGLGKNIFFIIIIFFVIIGAYNISGVINPITVLFNKDDQAAIEWIQNNTEPNASFLVDSFLWGGNYISSDGGSWITYLTGHKIIFPTSASDFNNIPDILHNKGIKYIYIGQGDGEINPTQFQIKPFELVYRNKSVKIYKVLFPSSIP